MSDSQLLSVNEGAEELHLTTSTVRAWILRRKIPHVKLGRRVFLRRRDVEALIAASVIPATLPPGRPAKLRKDVLR